MSEASEQRYLDGLEARTEALNYAGPRKKAMTNEQKPLPCPVCKKQPKPMYSPGGNPDGRLHCCGITSTLLDWNSIPRQIVTLADIEGLDKYDVHVTQVCGYLLNTTNPNPDDCVSRHSDIRHLFALKEGG